MPKGKQKLIELFSLLPNFKPFCYLKRAISLIVLQWQNSEMSIVHDGKCSLPFCKMFSKTWKASHSKLGSLLVCTESQLTGTPGQQGPWYIFGCSGVGSNFGMWEM